MSISILIPATTEAKNYILPLARNPNPSPFVPGSIWASGLGASESIAIEVPIVANPDAATDAHWTQPKVGGVSTALTADDSILSGFAATTIRIKKPITDAAVSVLCDLGG